MPLKNFDNNPNNEYIVNEEGNLQSREVAEKYIYNENRKKYPFPLSHYVVHHINGETLSLLSKELLIKKLYDEFLKMNINGCLVLFCSHASLTHDKESDIDLLYIGEIKESEKKKIKDMGKIYNKEIHLIIMDLKQFREQLSKQ